MPFPDYQNSIVNLMSTILNSFGVSSPYPELSSLPSKELIPKKNIILFVLDGLGYEFLMKEQESILKSAVRSKMSTVFPATTASAITTFLTGVPPSAHGITGWNMWLKELGTVSTILPFNARMGMPLGSALDIQSKIFDTESVFSKIKSQSFYVLPQKLMNSVYTLAFSGTSKKIPVHQLRDLFSGIHRCVKENSRKKYIYAYWNQYDHISHHKGFDSMEAREHVSKFASELTNLAKLLQGTSTQLILTADHGFVNTSRDKTIDLKDHPALADCLTLPLCGESRAVYCYVKPHKQEDFLRYIQHHLADACDCYPSAELLQSGVWGAPPFHPQIHNRIGDYVLVAKENYVIKDTLLTEDMLYLAGRHGGCSENEMFVPLMVFDFPERE